MKSADWPSGYQRRVLAEVGSTLDEARARAGDCAGPEWILAHHQSAARGRRGRAWAMPAGNFAATLLLPDAGAPERAALRSFVAALALWEACVSVSGTEEAFALKWPNDVLLREGKLAGILLETYGHGVLGIGIGVNLAAAPDAETLEVGAVRPVSLRAELEVTVGPEAFLDLLAAAYARWEAQFAQLGFEPIRRAWLDRAARLGELITARTMRDRWTGRFVDVDGQGQLVLETQDGRKTIPAAEIYF